MLRRALAPVPLGAIVALFALLFTTADAGAAEGLDLAPDPIPLAINFITLLLLIYPVKRWLLEPLSRVLQEREARTVGAAARSEELSGNAASLADQIEARLRDARTQSQRERAAVLATAEANERRILDDAREDAARRVAEVREVLEREYAAAREQLTSQGSALANLAASQILGRPL